MAEIMLGGVASEPSQRNLTLLGKTHFRDLREYNYE